MGVFFVGGLLGDLVEGQLILRGVTQAIELFLEELFHEGKGNEDCDKSQQFSTLGNQQVLTVSFQQTSHS